MKKRTIGVLLAGLLAACAGALGPYETHYQTSTEIGAGDKVEWLARGQSPSIFKTDDLAGEVEARRAEGYVVIGYSQFTGPLENTLGIQALAEENRATLVLQSALEVGKATKYQRVYDPVTGYSYKPVIAASDTSEAAAESDASDARYATEPVYRQTALFMVRRK